MIRIMLVLAMLAATAGAVVAYGDPDQITRASNSVTKMLRQRSLELRPPADARARRRIRAACQDQRRQGADGDDTGATSGV